MDKVKNYLNCHNQIFRNLDKKYQSKILKRQATHAQIAYFIYLKKVITSY